MSPDRFSQRPAAVKGEGPGTRARRESVARGCDDGWVPTLADLACRHTNLTSADLECLHALVSDWQLLADLSFADLILWAPLRDGSGWIALAQMRPTTGPTSFQDDVVGTLAPAGGQGAAGTARDERRIWRESDPDWTTRRARPRRDHPGDAARAG